MLSRWVRQIVRNAYRVRRSRDAPRRTPSSRGQEQQEHRAELVREAVEPAGWSVSGPSAVSRFQSVTAIGRLIGSSTSSSPDPPKKWRKNG